MDGGPFFVLNSNVICEYPLESLIDFHKSHNREAFIIIEVLCFWNALLDLLEECHHECTY
ncbi:hypothetical protein Syun_025855 [Stephania yunnanensis]|uniref:Uncharacterized protein n=1 Tax=Stephania yunnanensis TaxID=152371 RepID=A0AAP0EV26_9MAGN